MTVSRKPGRSGQRLRPRKRRPDSTSGWSGAISRFTKKGRTGAVEAVDAQVGPSLVLLRLRARGDAELELWGARRKRELFERYFDRDLEITLAPSPA